jgi:glycosyltransferase EpsH
MPEPLVSIIVPVFNGEQLLPRCLESLCAQTLREIEVIMVDDGSTDRSASVIDGYALTDNRFKTIHQLNSGVSAARNSGIAQARGRYVGFVDADDFAGPAMFERLTEAADKSGADIAFCGYMRDFDGHSSPKAFPFGDGAVFEGESRVKLLRGLIGPLAAERPSPEGVDTLSSVWHMIYRRRLVTESGVTFVDLKKIGTCEDLLFNLDMFCLSRRIVFIDRPLYHYNRANAGSLTANHRPELFTQWLRLYDEIGCFIEKHRLGEDCEEALGNRICLSVLNLAFNIVCAANRSGLHTKLSELNDILRHELIRHSFSRFSIGALPVRWRPFYWLAKHRITLAVLISAMLIDFLRRLPCPGCRARRYALGNTRQHRPGGEKG